MPPEKVAFYKALAVTAVGYVPGVLYCLWLEAQYRVRALSARSKT
jgi:hypothetical protein